MTPLKCLLILRARQIPRPHTHALVQLFIFFAELTEFSGGTALDKAAKEGV
jgi:hypothetical protein